MTNNWNDESFTAAKKAQKIFNEGLESSEIGEKRSRKEVGFQILTRARHCQVFAGKAVTALTQGEIDEAARLMDELEKDIAQSPDPVRDSIKERFPSYNFAD